MPNNPISFFNIQQFPFIVNLFGWFDLFWLIGIFISLYVIYSNHPYKKLHNWWFIVAGCIFLILLSLPSFSAYTCLTPYIKYSYQINLAAHVIEVVNWLIWIPFLYYFFFKILKFKKSFKGKIYLKVLVVGFSLLMLYEGIIGTKSLIFDKPISKYLVVTHKLINYQPNALFNIFELYGYFSNDPNHQEQKFIVEYCTYNEANKNDLLRITFYDLHHITLESKIYK
jgi:hypothetical protein